MDYNLGQSSGEGYWNVLPGMGRASILEDAQQPSTSPLQEASLVLLPAHWLVQQRCALENFQPLCRRRTHSNRRSGTLKETEA